MSERAKKTILLVEDDAIIALSSQKQLEQYRYNIIHVNTGEKAVEAIKTRPGIDLILMDINLGTGIDGTQTAEIILKDYDIPIVFISSHTEPEIVEKTEKITSYGYVVKATGITVLDSSIKMAFKLFDAKIAAQKRETLIYDLFPSADADVYFERIQRAAHSENPDAYEDLVPVPAGNLYFLSTYNKIVDINKNLLGIQIISQDITERKKAEESFKNSTKRLEGIIEGTHVGTWEWNVQTGETTINPIWAEMIGYTLEELAPISIQTWGKHAHPDDMKKSEESLRQHFLGNTPFYEIECRMRHKDGHWVWVLDIGKVITWTDDGKPSMMVGTHMDISKRKHTEHELEEKEEWFRSIFYKNNAVMLLIDIDTGMIKEANDSAVTFYGYPKEQLLTMAIWHINLLSPEEVKRKMQLALAEKRNHFTFSHRLSNGETRIVEVYSTLIRVLGNSFLFSIIHDITKQNLAEKKVSSLLEEKELLLKEVHHRIKNNMNTVSSLLSLQASRISEPKAILALDAARNRIRSMSMLYDKLYRSQDYTELSIKNYLSSLVDDVVANFPNSEMVKVEKVFQDFIVDVNRLQSLGIMISELITNIMKYAFTNADSGLITISAAKIKNQVMISVQDDGIGIPETVTFTNSTGFGLQLVQALAQQLDGSIRIERGNGTKIVVEFEI